MNRYFTFIVIGALLICFGCESHKIQNPTSILLMGVKSTNCSLANGYLKYENDTIQVFYIFWAEKGTMGLFIHNKLNKPLYVDWKKCSFITGTIKHDYWEETTTIKTTGDSYSNSYANTDYSIWKNLFYKNTSSSTYGFNSSTTQITKPERITFIPPGTTIYDTRYILSQDDIITKDYYSKDTLVYNLKIIKSQINNVQINVKGRVYYLAEDSIAYEPNSEKIYYKTYDSITSPIAFRSFVTYSTDEKFSSEAYVNSNFYVAQITKLSETIYKSRTFDTIGEKEGYNIWASPNSFYLWQYNE